MSGDIISTVGGTAGKIGRYFSIVSALPATVFVLYLYLLIRTEAAQGPVDWSSFVEFRPQDLVPLGVTALAFALVLNPLQYPLIRLYEGYWGTSTLAVELALIRTAHHRRREWSLHARELSATPPREPDGSDPLDAVDIPLSTLRSAVAAAENQRATRDYPARHRILPTRLGNVLRKYEDAITLPYGLDPLVSVPRLAMIAGQPETEYVENQRVQLELAIRTSFLALVATPITVAVMWRNGAMVLIALVPYAAAFLAYRGAVALAHEYGTSLAVLTDMSRFALYDRLRLRTPPDTVAEREVNAQLMELFSLRDAGNLHYERDNQPQVWVTAAQPPAPPPAAEGS